ncbi:MAG: alpha/beta hydrolase [Clostridiales bacterium]|nr:alpha/beta hydrolase [Clostridiales bacterium]
MEKDDDKLNSGKVRAETSTDLTAETVTFDMAENSEPTMSKAEQRKRKRAAKTSQAIFRAIDILFSASQNACPYINDKNLETIDCDEDVVYDDKNGGVCVMDVYRVKTECARPAVVLIHGGGFSAGDKKYRKGLSRFFAINGFTVFTVNYGLAPDYVFPEPIVQLVNAVNFVFDNADRFGIDRDRIIVAGDSAGAYYASIVATIGANGDYAAAYGCKVKPRLLGTVLNCGLYNMQVVLNSKYFLNIDDGVLVSFTGVRKSEFNDYKYKDVCMPFDYINSDFPPSFLIYSPSDFFCKNQGDVLKDRLDELGVYNEHYEARHNSAIHCFSLNWRGEDAFAANELMMSFAKRLAAGKIKF